MVDVSIIIVNYNTKILLSDCINSIYKNTFGLNYEIIVVDNDSNDGSQEFVKKQFPNTILIESNKNLGFGLANNLGVQSSKGEFLFFLNSDTVLIDNSVKILFDFYNENEKQLNLGAIGALLVDENNTINGYGSDFPTCKEAIKRNLAQLPLFSNLLSKIEIKTYPIEDPYFEIDYIIGADLYISKTLFNSLNGFSKDFFMYYEESDLQKRIANLGLKRYVITSTKIIHLEDGSGKAIKRYSNRKRIIVHKSRNIYLKKNDKENFFNHAIIDCFILHLNFLNFKYSFSENYNYIKEIVKTY